jgi:hypothetical protein
MSDTSITVIYHGPKKKVCLWLYCSNTLNVDEILKIYLIEQKIYPYHQDEWYVYHSDLSHHVSDCTVSVSLRWYVYHSHLSWYVSDSTMKVDWLIDWCLTSSEQFFSYIQDENI